MVSTVCHIADAVLLSHNANIHILDALERRGTRKASDLTCTDARAAYGMQK